MCRLIEVWVSLDLMSDDSLVRKMNNSLVSFAVQNLKMALKKQTFYNILKAFLSDTPQSIERQNRFRKNTMEKYIPSCGSK